MASFLSWSYHQDARRSQFCHLRVCDNIEVFFWSSKGHFISTWIFRESSVIDVFKRLNSISDIKDIITGNSKNSKPVIDLIIEVFILNCSFKEKVDRNIIIKNIIGIKYHGFIDVIQ